MKQADRKQWEKQQRQNRIIDIAENIFFEKGVDGTTIEEIAQAAGYNKRTLYLYFKDKEEIFLAVVLRALKLFNEMLQNAFQNPIEGKTIIFGLARAFYSFSIDHPAYFHLMMVYESRNCVYYPIQCEEKKYGEYREACQEVTDKNSELVTRAIESGITNGTILNDLLPRQLMLLLWGEIFGIMQIILMRKNHFEGAYGISYDELFDYFLETTERALHP